MSQTPFRPVLARLRGPLTLLLVILGFYWKVTLTRQFTAWNKSDLAKQVLPWFAYEARQFRHGHLPLWDPHSWGGQSLIGQGQPGVCYPLNWLLFAVGFNGRSFFKAIHIIDLYAVVIHFMGALFLYFLARELGRSRLASVVAGLAFAASAYMATVGWPQKMNGAIWTPLVFLFFVRIWRGTGVMRNAALAGACLGTAFLSGHHEAPVFIGLAVGGSWLYLLWQERGTAQFRLLVGALAVFGAFVLLISAVQLLPELEYGRLAFRWVGAKDPVDWSRKVPYSVHANFSLGMRSLIGIILPWFSDHEPAFVGWSGLVLAMVGVIQHWRFREVKLFFAVGLGGLLFSFGGNNTLHGLIYGLVPMVEKARSPNLAILLFGFAVSVLLAYGIDAIRSFEESNRVWCRRILMLLIAAAAVLTVSTLLVVSFGAKGIDPGMLMLSGFAAIALAALLYACWHSTIQKRTAQVLVAFLLALELGNVATANYTNIEEGWTLLDPLWKYSDIADFVRGQNDGARLEVDAVAIPFNFGDWYGVDTFMAYLASVTKNVFWVYSQSDYWCKMLFATQYYAGKKPLAPNQIPLFTSRDGIQVYKLPDALPRAWITHRMSTVSETEAARRLRAGEKLHDEPFMLGRAPSLELCDSMDEARLTLPGANREVIVAHTGCRGLLIDADAYYPGWSVQIDGRPGQMLEVYGALRAVEIPAGQHTIEFRYRSLSAVIGLILTLVGYAAIILIVVKLPRNQTAIST